MTLVVFLRGVNVGGNKTFRPSILARELSDYDVVNIGAAGTFVVRKPGSIATFRAELLKRLPFEADVALCNASDLLALITNNPFGTQPPRPDIVRFVSVLTKRATAPPKFPVAFPPEGQWLVRLIASREEFVFGEYRRDPKTIGYLSQIDKLFAGKVTTRNWNTITAIAKILQR